MSKPFAAYVPQSWAPETLRTLTTNNVLPSLIYRDKSHQHKATVKGKKK